MACCSLPSLGVRFSCAGLLKRVWRDVWRVLFCGGEQCAAEQPAEPRLKLAYCKTLALQASRQAKAVLCRCWP